MVTLPSNRNPNHIYPMMQNRCKTAEQLENFED